MKYVALSLVSLSLFSNDLPPIGYFIDNDPSALENQEQLLPSEKEMLESERVLIPDAKGVVLVGSYELVSHYQKVDGLVVKGMELPGSLRVLDEGLRPLYYGKSLTLKDVFEIKKAIILFYQDNGHPLVSIQLPEQEVTHGVLQLVVTESRVESVNAYGAKWFNNRRLANKLDLKPGKLIDEQKLVKNLEWINQNPFHRSDVIYSPGSRPDTTVVEVVTQDRFPLRVYAGAENSGLSTIGTDRVYGGLNWGNAFGVDQQITFQYTASDDFHEFQSYMGYYAIPLPWQHRFTLFGGYAKVHPKLHMEGVIEAPGHLRSDGMSIQVSGRYTIPLNPFGQFLHEVSAGFDFKRTNNTAFFNDVPIYGKLANLTQFLLQYSLGYERGISKTSFMLDFFFSPFKMASDESSRTYQTLRPGAKPIYCYGRIVFSEILRLVHNMSIVFNLKGQLASRPLLPSEQLGLGGYDTVRGYKERVINGDEGVYASLEYRTPVMNLFWRSKKPNGFHDRLQFLGFIDYGYAFNLKKPPGQDKHQFLLSVGPGMRYTISHYLATRLDWGIKLHRLEDDRSWSLINFSFELSY